MRTPVLALARVFAVRLVSGPASLEEQGGEASQ